MSALSAHAPATPPTDSPPPSGGAGELRALLRLAVPLVAGHAGSQFMGVVDTAMVGRLGAAAIGGTGLAGALWFAVSCLGLGIVLGAETLMAQAIGARDRGDARRGFWQAVWVALLVGAPLTALLAVLPLGFHAWGINAETSREATRCLWGRLPQIIPYLLFAACRSYLQGRGVTRPVVLAMVLSNLLNAGLNLLLIFGDGGLRRVGLPALGLPALGVLGSGLSTSIAQLGALLLMAASVRRVLRGDGPAPGAWRVDPDKLRRIARLGAPISLQILAEIGAFSLGAVLAGRLGAAASAGHQLAMTMASLSFMVTLGIGAAAAVRVGQHVGAGDTAAARRAGLLALGVSCAYMIASALILWLGAELISSLLTSDLVVIRSAVPLFGIAAVFQLCDGAQATVAGALRGAGDTRVSFVANLLGYYAVGLPLGVLLMPRLGVRGIWWGLTAGLTFVALGLIARFLQISRRPILRA